MGEIILEGNIPTLVVGLAPDRPVMEAVALMNANKSSYVLVVSDRKPIGIITERDMTILLEDSFSGANWRDITVDHVMTSPLVTVKQSSSLFDVIELMRDMKIRHAPVIDSFNEVVGVITPQVVIELLYRQYADY